MDAVIPAAGRGSRLGRLTDDRSKGLVEVAGRPLLAHVLETAVEAGADELVVIVGYEAVQIVDRFDGAFAGVPITYVHQRERKGSSDAVLQAEPHVDEMFLLVNGDNVFAGSVVPAVEATGEADTALAVEEVSPEVAATTGCYVLPEDVFHACALLRLSVEGEYQLSEVVGLLARAGYDVATVRVGERVNVNTLEGVERASELVWSS